MSPFLSGLLVLSSELHGVVHPVLFKCDYRNKEVMARDMLVTAKPWHSECNGGVERMNRTVEEQISTWMNANKSTHRTQFLPFIQWQRNTKFTGGRWTNTIPLDV